MIRNLPLLEAGVLVLVAAGCRLDGEPYTIARSDILDRYLAESPGRPALLVDIDDTLVDGGFFAKMRLALNLFPSWQKPFDEAPDSLKSLEERWNVVLVTARDDFFQKRTLRWLDRQSFPETPVVFSTCLLLSASSQADYKSAAIGALKRRGLRVTHGVGDKASDIEAYRRGDLRAVLILEDPFDEDLGETLETLEIDSWKPGDKDLGPIELVCLSMDRSWPLIVEHLQRN